MKITAQDLLKFGIIDKVIAEPLGGAHRDPEVIIDAVGDAIEAAIAELKPLKAQELRAARRQKFLDIGKTVLTL